MRRADRLFQIIQILRAQQRPITAKEIAGELETSSRTVYRDIADLMAHRIPIRGEAGIGYILGNGYDLPPLMLTEAEVEAAVLGARWVANQGDPALAKGAKDLISKLQNVIPEHLKPLMLADTMLVPPGQITPSDNIDVAKVRAWIRQQKRIRIQYQDSKEKISQRVLWPISIAYFGSSRLLVGWCELRNDFRHFRTDRIIYADFMNDQFPVSVDALQDGWRKQEASKQYTNCAEFLY